MASTEAASPSHLLDLFSAYLLLLAPRESLWFDGRMMRQFGVHFQISSCLAFGRGVPVFESIIGLISGQCGTASLPKLFASRLITLALARRARRAFISCGMQLRLTAKCRQHLGLDRLTLWVIPLATGQCNLVRADSQMEPRWSQSHKRWWWGWLLRPRRLSF